MAVVARLPDAGAWRYVGHGLPAGGFHLAAACGAAACRGACRPSGEGGDRDRLSLRRRHGNFRKPAVRTAAARCARGDAAGAGPVRQLRGGRSGAARTSGHVEIDLMLQWLGRLARGRAADRLCALACRCACPTDANIFGVLVLEREMFMRFVVGLCALLLAVVTGHDAVASPEGKRVMLLGTANTNPYIGAWTSTFTKFATQAGMKVTNLSSNYDAAVQSQQVDDAIAQKFDLIAVVYVNDQAIIPALTRAKAAGIPVVLIVTPLKKEYEDLFISYIGTDHAELGRLAAEGMVKGLQAEGKTKAQVVAITGAAQQLNVQTRMAAFKEVLAKHPGVELVANEDGR